MDLLNPKNLCGQNLLRIVSRGSAIIAEEYRLSDNIPEAFLQSDDKSQDKYQSVLFDFQYFREPEEFEKKINASVDLLELDAEFQENHEEILDRFYRLFESILKYQQDLSKFVDDVANGYYIQHSLENILDETDGKQLLCEAVYLYGIMLLTMEEKLSGGIRERMLIALYRYNGDARLINIEDVCKLCRSTGYIAGINGRKPKRHPESLFNRFPLNPELLRLLIGKFQTDDIYLMSNSFPSPEHRSTRLSAQASMLYVILYFIPEILNSKTSVMRELVDKYFNDNWVISLYMGSLVDITHEWLMYPAAKTAIENQITMPLVKELSLNNINSISKSLKSLQEKLHEGVLVPEYVLDNISPLINLMREANIALKWRILHRKCHSVKFQTIILNDLPPQTIMNLLLNLSQYEYMLKNILSHLLEERDHAWNQGKQQAAEYLTELSEYFTGEKIFTRVKRNDKLIAWFQSLSNQIMSLDLELEHTTSTGRKIQGIIVALEDVEQFEEIDNDLQIKNFLSETRELLKSMIRTVNIKNESVHIIDNISDFSYGWIAIKDYLQLFQNKIVQDPKSVIQLRATFLKNASILDIPLIRIVAINSPDSVSVAEYYSSELVTFVSSVLEIIPRSVFKILHKIEQIQTNQMVPIPLRLEAKDLKEYSQLDSRLEMSKLTYEVSIFTEGILLMQKTLLGVIQIDPREILEQGLRRELVRLMSYALHEHTYNISNITRTEEIHSKYSYLAIVLDGMKRSIEYLQDFIDLPGLKIFQEEMSRVINYNIEQEANKYVKIKIFDGSSRYQNKAIPIPKYLAVSEGRVLSSNLKDFTSFSVSSTTKSSSFDKTPLLTSINFMGRVMESLLFLTDSAKTVYSSELACWYQYSPVNESSNQNLMIRQNKSKMTTAEACGSRTMTLLEKTLGTIGLRGLDRLLSFRNVYQLNQFVRHFDHDWKPAYQTLFDEIRRVLEPTDRVINFANISKLLTTSLKKLEPIMSTLLHLIQKVGQNQLLRKHIHNTLQFTCQLDANLLHLSLNNYNNSLLNDIKKHYIEPDKYPYPEVKNPVLYESSLWFESCGMDDPFRKVYVTSHCLEDLPILLLLFIVTYIPKLEYDSNFGSLTRRKPKYPVDGYPLLTGTGCILQQFNPHITRKFLQYIGVFITMSIQTVYSSNDIDSLTKPVKMPEEIIHIIIFIQQLCVIQDIQRETIDEFIPAYIYDSALVHLRS